MGGYHWTEIVVRRALIYPFVFFALLVPVVNLHFFLVFPRQNPVLLTHRRLVLALLYGIPALFLVAIWGSMFVSHWFRFHDGGVVTVAAERVIRGLALTYIALAAVIFALCIPCLIFSYRRADTRAEKNQVKWILLASLLASVLISYLLWQAWIDTATLGRDSAAWPMVGVSLLYTIAYAFSITRYKLMQVEEIINRSVVYFAFSVIAGLTYSALLLVSGWLIGDRLLSTNPTSWGRWWRRSRSSWSSLSRRWPEGGFSESSTGGSSARNTSSIRPCRRCGWPSAAWWTGSRSAPASRRGGGGPSGRVGCALPLRARGEGVSRRGLSRPES